MATDEEIAARFLAWRDAQAEAPETSTPIEDDGDRLRALMRRLWLAEKRRNGIA